MRTLSCTAALGLLIAAAGCVAAFRVANLPKQEWITVPVGMVDGVCKMIQKRPAELRTEARSQVHWIVTGNCTGNPTVAIDEFKLGETSVPQGDLFDPNGTSLEGKLPTIGTEPFVRLHGRLKSGLQKAHYTYRVLINGQPAQFQSPADRGDMFMCPVWPCGDYR